MSATQKLVKLGVDREVAEKLTSNNILTPAAIRKASISELRSVTGLDNSAANELKNKFNRGS